MILNGFLIKIYTVSRYLNEALPLNPANSLRFNKPFTSGRISASKPIKHSF